MEFTATWLLRFWFIPAVTLQECVGATQSNLSLYLIFISVQSILSYTSPEHYWRDKSVCPRARVRSVCKGVIFPVRVGLLVFTTHIHVVKLDVVKCKIILLTVLSTQAVLAVFSKCWESSTCTEELMDLINLWQSKQLSFLLVHWRMQLSQNMWLQGIT